MRKLQTVVFLSLAVVATGPETLLAQLNVWTSLGPQGGSIGAIAVDPQDSRTAYAARGDYGGGVFKTTDGGASWNAINSGLLTSGPVSALAIDSRDPNTVYAGIRYYPGGLYKSIDGGRNWLHVDLPQSRGFRVVFSLVFVPDDPDTIYAVVSGPNGVLKSSDRERVGMQWTSDLERPLRSSPSPSIRKAPLRCTRRQVTVYLERIMQGRAGDY